MGQEVAKSPKRRNVRRTQAERTEEAKRRILAAAAELLNVRGYDAMTMADVASEAGVSKGLVLYHFGTKERLFEELERDIFQQAFEQAVTLFSESTGQIETLEAGIDFLWDTLQSTRSHLPLFFVLAQRSGSNGGASSGFIDRLGDAFLDQHDLLEKGVAITLGPSVNNLRVPLSSFTNVLLFGMVGLTISSFVVNDEAFLKRGYDDLKMSLYRLFDKLPPSAAGGNRREKRARK